MKLKKCIGIVSYFPEEDARHARSRRIERCTNLLKQINNIGPNIDILIIAQNWQDYSLPDISNNIILFSFNNPLTIVGAREVLRKKVIELSYDYVILLDDDAHICYTPEAATAYLEEIDNHPNSFCFIHSDDHWHTCDDYIKAPLNLCAISRQICELEPIPEFYLEKTEALEDDIYAVLLHIKYPEYEFLPPKGIYCDHYVTGQYIMQFFNSSIWPSTWNKQFSTFPRIIRNTQVAIQYIIKNHKIDRDAVITSQEWNRAW